MNIRPKNYAAQSERSMKNFYTNCLKMGYQEEAVSAMNTVAMIQDAVHFTIPDEGKILDDRLKGIDGVAINLPYPIITLEYYQGEIKEVIDEAVTAIVNKKLLIAAQMGDVISLMAVFCHNGVWVPAAAALLIESDWSKPLVTNLIVNPFMTPTTDTHTIRTRGHRILYPLIFKTLVEIYGEEKANAMVMHDISSEVRPLMEFLEALSCKNVSIATCQEKNAKINKRRAKSGKLPFYETKMLVISASKESKESEIKGGSHASPRQHLRRGHIRRLESGNIWVNSCVVGSGDKGHIEKRYMVMK
jgi:hypothetical protein